MTINLLKSAVVAAALIALSACGGTMQGKVRGTGKPVSFSYEQGMSSDTLTATVDGETFQGKSVLTGTRSTHMTGYSAAGPVSVIGQSSSGAAQAIMFGSKGSTLTCQLHYADSSGFTTMGGVGACQHSDGRIIDVLW